MSQRSTTMNALIGAVVTVVTSFVPFSPVVGGAVAGYLEGRDGARVGAISGGMAAVPILLLGFLFMFFIPLGMGMGMGVRAGIGMFLFWLLALVVVLVYTVGLSAVGGLIGTYLAEGRNERRAGRAAEGDTPADGEPADVEASAD